MIYVIFVLHLFIIHCDSFLQITPLRQNIYHKSKHLKGVELYAIVFQDDPNHTLYDILDCSPQASREELKKQYIKLAKILHPDACIDSKETENNVEFSEVAAAWKILSDDQQRRRYDRSLRANEFVSDIEKTASKLGESAAPHVKNVFDTVLNPIFRRTSVTTSAALTAAVEDISQQNITNIDLKKTVEQAFKAVQNAGESMRQVELVEKVEKMEQRSLEESNVVDELARELKKVTSKRINYAIHTPKSAISSMEAKYFLER